MVNPTNHPSNQWGNDVPGPLREIGSPKNNPKNQKVQDAKFHKPRSLLGALYFICWIYHQNIYTIFPGFHWPWSRFIRCPGKRVSHCKHGGWDKACSISKSLQVTCWKWLMPNSHQVQATARVSGQLTKQTSTWTFFDDGQWDTGVQGTHGACIVKRFCEKTHTQIWPQCRDQCWLWLWARGTTYSSAGLRSSGPVIQWP